MATFNDETLVVLASTRTVLTLPDDTLLLTPATATVSPSTGKILSVVREVLPKSSFPPQTLYKDCSPKFLMPGLVDAHVHLNEPGRTEWEGFNTGTRAAASGGVTTVVDMPLNAIPPTTTLAGFKEKLRASQGQCWVDVGFYGGVVPGNAGELLGLVEAGVRGFKGFLIDSGVEEFPAVSANDIAKAMITLKDAPTTLMFHAEMLPPITDSLGDYVQTSEAPLAPKGELFSYNTFLNSRPPAFETYAIEEILSMAELAPNLHLHIVHLSALECIPILREARKSGINITAETCFHYLGLASDDIEDGDTRHKCCPPIRSQANQGHLWDEVSDPEGCIKTIVSDHSPCTPQLKMLPPHLQTIEDEAEIFRPNMHHSDSGIDVSYPQESQKKQQQPRLPPITSKLQGDFFAAWGGISSVGLGLPILYTTATDRAAHGYSAPSVVDIVRMCCQATAKQVGLSHRKGGIKPGMDADFCVFDADDVWTLRSGDMRWKNKCSPWEGHTFRGRVQETWLRGRKVFQLHEKNMGFVEGRPIGEAIIERRTAH